MAAKGIKRKIELAKKNVEREITGTINDSTPGSSKYSRGLSGEGYFGGYMAALDDVLLALNGVAPQRNEWWEDNYDQAK